MKSLSRREFIRRVAAGAGGLTGAWLLDACAREQAVSPPPDPTSPAAKPAVTSLPPTMESTAASTAAPTPTEAPTAAPTQPEPSVLSVARGGEPEELVKRALAALGGIERFVHPGDDVIIKPNICIAYSSYEYAATTNPWVVGALVKLSLGAGAKQVRVMDFPFGGKAERAYKISGIRKEVEAAGGIMEYMTAMKYKEYQIPDGVSLKKCMAYADAKNASVLINVPIAKHHSLAGLTIGMKNLMGLILEREKIHTMLNQRLADLTSLFRPALTVVDAVRILTDNGPTGGSLDDVKKLDTVIASADIVAADSYAITLFGMKPADLLFPDIAAKMGLGTSDLTKVKIEEIQL